jgi:hypothetical protein
MWLVSWTCILMGVVGISGVTAGPHTAPSAGPGPPFLTRRPRPLPPWPAHSFPFQVNLTVSSSCVGDCVRVWEQWYTVSEQSG